MQFYIIKIDNIKIDNKLIEEDDSVKRLSGVRVPHSKNTADMPPEMLPTPALVTIPMSMHSGTPAVVTVGPGDEVKVGQVIGEASGRVSAMVHASVSGKVKKITEVLMPSGRKTQAVVIESDGLQEPSPELCPHPVESMEEFISVVKDSGAVGLGGAVYPTYAKFAIDNPNDVEVFIVNGAECEPYLTGDNRTMIDDADLVVDGAELLLRFFPRCRVVIGIEDNKQQAIKTMTEKCANNNSIEVRELPARYPQGSKNVILYSLTGKVVAEGARLTSVGALIINCTTLSTIARYIKTGMPLVSKYITVDGTAVKTPKNVIVPIGTSIGEVLAYCGFEEAAVRKILIGGPMMGISVHDIGESIVKGSGAVLAFKEADALTKKETACIRCGRCVEACPLNLMPLEFETAYKLKKPEILEKLGVNVCMECGCCAYICPAARPLVQTFKLAKTMLREYQNAKKNENAKQDESIKTPQNDAQSSISKVKDEENTAKRGGKA